MKTIVWIWFLFQVQGVPAYVKYPVDSLPECIQSINKHYPRVVESFPDAVALCEKTNAPVASPRPKAKPEVY